MSNMGGHVNYDFDLSNGNSSLPDIAINSGATGHIEDVGNGWWRCSVTYTVTVVNPYPSIFLMPSADTFDVTQFQGDGTSGVYMWGHQIETGAFPTSYIPTTGSTVTRAADIARIPTSSFGYNQEEGTIVMEANTISTLPTNHDDLRIVDELGFVMTNSGSRIGGYESGSYVVYSPVTDVNIKVYSVISDGQTYKAAFVLKDNNFALSVNGSAVVTDTATNFSGRNAHFFNLGKGYKHLNGHIKSLKYYPRQLTDTQLQELTT